MDVLILIFEQFFEVFQKVIFVDLNFTILVIKPLNFAFEHVPFGFFDMLRTSIDLTKLIFTFIH